MLCIAFGILVVVSDIDIRILDLMNVDNALDAIRTRWPGAARVGIILGTGLGELAEQVEAEAIVDYDDIPGFGKSTALAHKGRLICGTLAGAGRGDAGAGASV